MTPRQARAARAMLGLDMKTVCALANLGKRTLTEFESGSRAIYGATESKIKAFYISKGVSFPASGDWEGVSFAAPSARIDESSGEVSDKVEYIDLLGVGEAIEKTSSIVEIQKELDSRPTISQLILVSALKKSGLKQKEFAVRMDCTASFVNAVAVGKKTIPLSYSVIFQCFFEKENFDVAKALYQEKLIMKLSSKLASLQEANMTAWRAILP